MPPTTSAQGAVPLSTSIATLVTLAALLVLAALGITDGALPELVRLEVPPAVGALIAVLAVTHHRTLQAAHDAAAALGAVATTTAAATAPGTAPQVIANDAAAVMATIGGLIETNRAGVLAVSESGRHLSTEPPTAALPPAVSYPPALTSGVSL